MSQPALPPDVFAKVTQAWAIQDYAEGERLLAAACRTHPDHWHLRTCHAAALGYCSRFSEAKAAFDSLIDDAPPEKKIHMHGLLGVEWCRIGRHDLAIPLLRVAVAAPSPVAPIYEALASAQEHLGQYAEARETLSEGLRQHPEHPGMMLVLARVQHHAREFDLAEQTAYAVWTHPKASPEALSMAGHELSAALDAQKRFAEAFTALKEAKTVRQAQLAPFKPIWERGQQHLNNLTLLPTRADFMRWAAAPRPQPECRLAFLVGCPRSGTTLLERVMDAHPDLVSASETTVFNNVWNSQLHRMRLNTTLLGTLDGLGPADIGRLRDAYWTQMAGALDMPAGGRLLLDKNPSQLTQMPAACRLFPESKILMAVRDPRAIAWSCYSQHLPDNAESAGFNTLRTTAAHVAGQLRFWLHLRRELPANQWHETRYENMVGDFEAESKRTLAFLGLPWDAGVAQFHANPSPVRSPTYAQASQPVYAHAVDKWRNYSAFIGDAFDELDGVAKELGYSTRHRAS